MPLAEMASHHLFLGSTPCPLCWWSSCFLLGFAQTELSVRVASWAEASLGQQREGLLQRACRGPVSLSPRGIYLVEAMGSVSVDRAG